MSKIYRSMDLQKTQVTEVKLGERRVGPQNPARPTGGFQDCQGGEGPVSGELLSHLERSRREAARILENASHQAEIVQRDAYREGFAQGERAGEKLALQKSEPIIAAFQELIAAVQNERASLIHQHEQELIKLAFAIATQVLKTQIELDPGVLGSVIEGAMDKVSRAQEITLRVSPNEIPLLNQIMRRDGGTWPPPHVKVEADETVGRGGCRIETETGDIDATIETQLRVLKNALWSE